MSQEKIKPYTETELEVFKVTFKNLPFYKSEDGGYVTTDNIPELAKAINYNRTDEELAVVKEYFDKQFGGRVTFANFVDLMATLHDTTQIAINQAKLIDADGNGFISQDEFASLLKSLKVHDGRLREVTFEEFVTAADSNQDGLVSVEECAEWIRKALGD